MAVFSIREDLDLIMNNKGPMNLMKQTDDLVRMFGKLHHRINFNQNLRSADDFIFNK